MTGDQSKMESEASVGNGIQSKMESEASVGNGICDSKRKHVMMCSPARHDGGRWRRSAGIGKGRGDCKRDRESEGEGSNSVVDNSCEIEIEKIETPSNPKRSLDMNVSVIRSVGSGGQSYDDVQQQRPNTQHSTTTSITPGSDNPVSALLSLFDIPRNNDDPDQPTTTLHRECYPFCPHCPPSLPSEGEARL